MNNPAILQINASALPDSWIERLFQKMEDRYGSMWVDRYGSFPRERVKNTWAEDLAGFSGEEIKRGLDACKTRTFPPTLPEFVNLCRPAMDYEALYISAANALNDGNWKNKMAYWATKSVGQFEVRNEPFKRMESRWKKAVDELRLDGDLPDIPPRQEALPAPGKTSISKEEAAKRKSEIGLNMGKKHPKAWAKKIIEHQENYPSISLKFAQEAIMAAA